tara:strand:- start:55871 stop:56812 length:942 start_codon:yes stop_codon:yes gene_type:complete
MTSNTQDKFPVIVTNDEVDLVAIIQVLWHGKWLIMGITLFFAIASIVYALNLPNIYQSTALIAPAESSSQPKGGQLQGLASIAGLDLSAARIDKKDIAVATIRSHRFIKDFIDRKKIMVPLMTIIDWDQTTNTPIFDENIYDREANKWTLTDKPKPSDIAVYEKFKTILTVSEDMETGFIEISINFPVPELAQTWATWLVEDINQYTRNKDINQSNASIEYLQKQLDRTQIADIRTIFYSLIKQETQKILLAETREEYIFETIDPPVKPEIKTAPKRALIVIISTMLGGLFSLFAVLVRHVSKNASNSLAQRE